MKSSKNLAIARSIQSRSKKKLPKDIKVDTNKGEHSNAAPDDLDPKSHKHDEYCMFNGGVCTTEMAQHKEYQEPMARKPDDRRLPIDQYMGDKMAEGGEVKKPKVGGVGGAETSTTGNKTKTGGSNPGGASTGGAGTVTITTGGAPPKSISVSDVGGRTDARNAGGMDPSDENDDATMMAAGGEVSSHYDSIADAIMRKKRFAEGGMVDLADNSEEHPNEYYSDNSEASRKELYDDSQISSQPEDSNESGDLREKDAEDKHDMVSAIMRKRRAKK